MKTDSEKNHDLLIKLTIQQDKIWKELTGEPEFGRRGIVRRLEIIEDDIKNIKQNGLKIRWFRNGAIATGGVLTGWFGKAWWAKVTGFFSALPK